MGINHNEMMEKAWRFIHHLNISEDIAARPDYLVKDIYRVRDAYYSDLENDTGQDDESILDFFARHNIEWTDPAAAPDYCTQNNGDCSTCSLVNYGRDCMNNPISQSQTNN